MSPPFKEAVFDIIYGQGISKEGELIELGVVMDIVEKSGAWFSYEGERLGNGKEKTRQFLKEHPEVALEIEGKLRSAYGLLAEKVTESISEMQSEDEQIDGPLSEE
jgi:recombination protein RecA